ncbi:MAG: septation protein A [Cycloclasticus sp.]|nr:MAG: septation protein A [Cycloclasticus sp.]
MKILFDFFPILLFYIAFKWQGIYIAVVVAMAASAVQVSYFWLKNRRVENTHLITFVIIAISGGATLYLQNEMFFKWKPTIINWLFAIVCIGSHFIGEHPIIRRMMSSTITLPTPVWYRLNTMWALFFIFMGSANLVVVYNFSTDIWADFKLFGMLSLTLLFILAQGFYLAKHIEEPQEALDTSPNKTNTHDND